MGTLLQRARAAIMLGGAVAVLAASAAAQRPDIPPQAIVGPRLSYEPVDQADALAIPDETELGQVASVAIGADEHIYVLNRGQPALLDFDAQGRFVRSVDVGPFDRAHGLYIDEQSNFWITDVAANTVTKYDRNGKELMVLGTAGRAGNWDESGGQRLFDQPTDVALGPNGEIFVAQGHNGGEPSILKFDASGKFIRSWGGRGTHPWQLAVAHSLAIGPDRLLYVADRENRRILVFDLDGNFVKGWLYRGMACGLHIAADGTIHLVTGFDGQVVQIDSLGRVMGVFGAPGEGLGEFGEAHDIAVAGNGDIYVADVVNRRVQKFVAR